MDDLQVTLKMFNFPANNMITHVFTSTFTSLHSL